MPGHAGSCQRAHARSSHSGVTFHGRLPSGRRSARSSRDVPAGSGFRKSCETLRVPRRAAGHLAPHSLQARAASEAQARRGCPPALRSRGPAYPRVSRRRKASDAAEAHRRVQHAGDLAVLLRRRVTCVGHPEVNRTRAGADQAARNGKRGGRGAKPTDRGRREHKTDRQASRLRCAVARAAVVEAAWVVAAQPRAGRADRDDSEAGKHKDGQPSGRIAESTGSWCA